MGRQAVRATQFWTGAPFTVHVRRSGQLGLSELGTPDDVPPYLARLAAGMWAAGLSRCGFYWSAGGATPLCRVTLEVQRDGSFEHVQLTGRPVDELPHGLSPRELEVLTLVTAGLGNAELADELAISERTAATHVNHLLQKLELPTRTAAATYALDLGLVAVPLPGAVARWATLSLGRLLATTTSPTPVSTAGAVGSHRRRTGDRPARRRELVVGAVLPLTGKGSEDGREMLNGLRLAVEEVNGAGGIRGRTVRADVVDVDVTASASVRTAFESLLHRGVDVLTSGYLAAQEVGHEIAGRSGVPYLHAATSGVLERAVRDDLPRFGRVFQICASDSTYAPSFVSYLTSLRDRGHWLSPSRRLVVLQKGWRHVNFGVAEAETLAAARGWELECVPVTGPEQGDGWLRAVAHALRQPAAAIMIGSFFVDDAVQAVAALRVSKAPTLAYAIYAPSVPAFRHQLGELAEGVLWATMTGTYSDSGGIAFARRYRHRFGVQPGRSHAGLAYDRMQRIALAWRLTEDLSDAGDVATQLRAQPYRGVNGTYNFDTPGQAARGFDSELGDPSLAQPQLIYQIQDGQQVIVSGGPFRTGEFRLPGHLLPESVR